MAKSIKEYLAEAEGRTWTPEDTAFVKHVFDEVDRTWEKIVERRVAETRNVKRKAS